MMLGVLALRRMRHELQCDHRLLRARSVKGHDDVVFVEVQQLLKLPRHSGKTTGITGPGQRTNLKLGQVAQFGSIRDPLCEVAVLVMPDSQRWPAQVAPYLPTLTISRSAPTT
jgi:hypothetical protein